MEPLLRVLGVLGILGLTFASPSRHQAGEQEGLMECFQVSQPLLGPEGPTPSWGREITVGDGQGKCEMLLMEHSFGASYDKPFVGTSLELKRSLSAPYIAS